MQLSAHMPIKALCITSGADRPTTATFIGGTWDHQNISGRCESCHDGDLATGKSNTHFSTSQDCDVCHRTSGWSPINFSHSTSDYPGDHNGNVSCLSCHRNNNENINYSSPGFAPFCAACHEGDYDPGEHDGTLSDNKECGNSGCHLVSDRDWWSWILILDSKSIIDDL